MTALHSECTGADMPCFHAFWDREASCLAIWAAMLGSLGAFGAVSIWIAAAVVSLAASSNRSLRSVCPETLLWPILLLTTVFTGVLTAVAMRLILDAQSGMPPLGDHWPHERKRLVVAATAGIWLVLWCACGGASLESCVRGELAGDAARQVTAAWFYTHIGALGVIGLLYAAKRGRKARADRREAQGQDQYRSQQAGGANSSSRVLI